MAFTKQPLFVFCDGNDGDHLAHWAEWGYLDDIPVYECDEEWPL